MKWLEKRLFVSAFKTAQAILLREYSRAKGNWPRLGAVLHYLASVIIPEEIERIKKDETKIDTKDQ